VARFTPDLKQAMEDGLGAEAEQERLKQRYLEEAKDDQGVAEEGYRWMLQLSAKARHAMAADEAGKLPDLAGRLRFGKTRVPRMRGVLYNLRVVLPELDELKAELKPYGVDEAFIARGKDILKRAGVERAETAAVKAERERMTRQVRDAELRISRLLHRLDTADAAAAMERPEARRYFTLQLIRTEQARLEAERAVRELQRPAGSDGATATDDE
jgi:hypothetical protein